MSVWLTPDLKPFYGGTYYPGAGRYCSVVCYHLVAHLNQWALASCMYRTTSISLISANQSTVASYYAIRRQLWLQMIFVWHLVLASAPPLTASCFVC